MRSIKESTNTKAPAAHSSLRKETDSEQPASRRRPRTPEVETRFGAPYSPADDDPFGIGELAKQNGRFAELALKEMTDAFLLNSVWEVIAILDAHKEKEVPPAKEELFGQGEIDAELERTLSEER